jgi:hypothetical protein
MFLFKYIRRLFLAAFPQPVLLLPAIPAGPAASLPYNSHDDARSHALRWRRIGCVLECAASARTALSRFRIGPYANGPP